MNFSRKIIISLGLIMFLLNLNAQFDGISGGLTFSSGVDYNTGTTGNPGIFCKMYFEVDKRTHIVPSLSVYKAYKRSNFSQELRTHMFHGDLDGVYSIYKDKAIRFMGFAGLNTTAIISKWKILENNPNLSNMSDLKPGLNLGGAFHLYVDDTFDAYISGKYIVSTFNQLVINVGAIYYIGGKHRKGNW